MAYTTLAQIKSMFRQIQIEDDTGSDATSTVVTTEDVTQFIADADAEIDATLAEYYIVPITGTESLKYINVISKYKVAQVIKTILEAKVELSDRDQEVQTNLGKQADKMLAALVPQYKNGKMIDPQVQLTDAPRTEISPKGGSVFGINYATSSPARSHTIKKGGDNW